MEVAMGVNVCQCLAARLVKVMIEGKSGMLDVGHIARPSFDALAALLGVAPEKVGNSDGAKFLVLRLDVLGGGLYAQCYADAETEAAHQDEVLAEAST